MNLDEYQAFIIPRSNVDVNDTATLALCGLGLAEESAEVLVASDDHDAAEVDSLPSELGDVLWYVTAALAYLHIKPSDLPVIGVPEDLEDQPLEALYELMFQSGLFAGICKKVWNHNHPVDMHRDAMVTILGEVLSVLRFIASSSGLTVEQVADVNVKKITERYPSGFTTEDSIRRTDVH